MSKRQHRMLPISWETQQVFLREERLELYQIPSQNYQNGRIIFCHGWGEPPLSYHELLSQLARLGWRVTAPAFPGYAASKLFRRPFISPVTRGSSRVAKVLSPIPGEKPWLVAHSMGAATAVRIAERNPGRISGLVLICPIGQPSIKAKDWLRAATDLRSGNNRIHKLGPILKTSPLYLAAAGIDSKRHNLLERYEKLINDGTPITVIRTSDDRVVNSHQFDNIPGMKIIEVSGNHGFPLNNPLLCAELVHESTIDKIYFPKASPAHNSQTT